ncbi:MAG: ArsA family ATPase [Actinomycetota bacterium]
MSESPLPSLTAARVVIVAGKGGVGKTTVTAVLARAAVTDGRRVLVVELDGKPTLADWFAGLDADPPDGARLDVIHLSAADALDEYLREHGFQRIAKRLSSTGVIDMVGTAAPGIDDVVVLGKIKQLERAGDHDLIIVDGPAAGHAITFLTSASGLADAVRGGPVKRQSDDVLELLADGDRAMVVLVTLPETTPVNETVETAFSLEDDVGVRLGPVVVNAVDAAGDLPSVEEVDDALTAVEPGEAASLRGAWEFRRSRRAMEVEALDRLGERLPLAQVHLPALPVAGLGAHDIDVLASHLTEDGPT